VCGVYLANEDSKKSRPGITSRPNWVNKQQRLIVQHHIYAKATVTCITEVQGIYFTCRQVGHIKVTNVFPGGGAV
jgi:hypothetical protein